MIIDAHTHVGREGTEVGKPVPVLLRSMKRAGISKSLVIDLFRTESGYTKQEMIDVVTAHKNLALAGTFDMMRGSAKDLKFLDTHLKRGDYVAIKLYPGYQHFYPSEKKCDKIYGLCVKHNVPVIFHTGDVWDTDNTALVKYAMPIHLDDVAIRFPKLKIVMAHLGTPFFQQSMEVLYKNHNVYADLSGFLVDPGDRPCNDFFRRTINNVICYARADRMMFGSDFGLADQSLCVRFVKSLQMPKETRPLVMHRNAEQLYGF
jgi:predicted TIM-barrel fold metal-dependent hydrolase